MAVSAKSAMGLVLGSGRPSRPAATDSSLAYLGRNLLRTFLVTEFTMSTGALVTLSTAVSVLDTAPVIWETSSRISSTRMSSRFTLSTVRVTRSTSGSTFFMVGCMSLTMVSMFLSVGSSSSMVVMAFPRTFLIVMTSSTTNHMSAAPTTMYTEV